MEVINYTEYTTGFLKWLNKAISKYALVILLPNKLKYCKMESPVGSYWAFCVAMERISYLFPGLEYAVLQHALCSCSYCVSLR